MATSISLEDNCGEAGARLKVSPMGILPQDSEVRLYLGQGLSDLSGEGLPSSVDGPPSLATVSPGPS